MIKFRVFLILALLNLCGCNPTPDKAVVEFIKEAKEQKPGYVENTLVIVQPKVIKYDAGSYRDPFESAGTIRTAAELRGKSNFNGPDANRPREPLENFSIDSLKMVGTIERDKNFFALIRAGNGEVHLAKVGDHLGQNSGEIKEITSQSIEIQEWIPDGKGGWQKHKNIMPLWATKNNDGGNRARTTQRQGAPAGAGLRNFRR